MNTLISGDHSNLDKSFSFYFKFIILKIVTQD